MLNHKLERGGAPGVVGEPAVTSVGRRPERSRSVGRRGDWRRLARNRAITDLRWAALVLGIRCALLILGVLAALILF